MLKGQRVKQRLNFLNQLIPSKRSLSLSILFSKHLMYLSRAQVTTQSNNKRNAYKQICTDSLTGDGWSYNNKLGFMDHSICFYLIFVGTFCKDGTVLPLLSNSLISTKTQSKCKCSFNFPCHQKSKTTCAQPTMSVTFSVTQCGMDLADG